MGSPFPGQCKDVSAGEHLLMLIAMNDGIILQHFAI
jgi:hypothetical protein